MRYQIAFAPLAFAVLCTIAPGAGSAAEPPVPKTPALLDRVMKACLEPGPMTIVTTELHRRPGQPDVTIKATTQWNDANHFRVTASGAGSLKLFLANGSSRIIYASGDNSYEHSEKTPEKVMPLLQGLLKGLEPALADPESRHDLAKGIVTPTTYNDEPVYRIYIELSARTKGQFVAFLVGREDMLVRKLVMSSSATSCDTLTNSFKAEAKPFPPSTFGFTPPAGAKDITR